MQKFVVHQKVLPVQELKNLEVHELLDYLEVLGSYVKHSMATKNHKEKQDEQS